MDRCDNESTRVTGGLVLQEKGEMALSVPKSPIYTAICGKLPARIIVVWPVFW